MPAVVALWGPPWSPGKTALSMALAWISLQRIIAPRGPRRVLWVVVVTTSAKGTGYRVGAAGHEAREVGHVDEEDAAASSAMARNLAKSSSADRPSGRR
jgi:hypothetical protein